MSLFIKSLDLLNKQLALGAHLSEVADLFKGAIDATGDGIEFLHFYPDGKIICKVYTNADFAPFRALSPDGWEKYEPIGDSDSYKATIFGVRIFVDVLNPTQPTT